MLLKMQPQMQIQTYNDIINVDDYELTFPFYYCPNYFFYKCYSYYYK